MPNETHDWQDTYARLNALADADNPASWMPEVAGEELFGEIIGVNEAAPTKFGSSPVVTIRKPDGEHVSLWLLHTVLRREFERHEPKIGELVLVRYQGRVTPGGDGNDYESYAVLLDRTQLDVDWKRIAARYGDDLDPDPNVNDPAVQYEQRYSSASAPADAPLGAGHPPASSQGADDSDIPF